MPRPIQVRLEPSSGQPRRGRVHGLHHRLSLVQLALEQSLIVPDLVDELLHPELLGRELQVFGAQLGHQLVVVVHLALEVLVEKKGPGFKPRSSEPPHCVTGHKGGAP